MRIDPHPSRFVHLLSTTLVLSGLFAAAHLLPTGVSAQEEAPAAAEPAAPPVEPPLPSAPVVIAPPAFQGRGASQPVPALGLKGQVIAVHDLTATVSVGARQGVAPGAHVLFIGQASSPDDPFVRGTEDQVVIGEVINVTEDAALVSLGMLEGVAVGQQVEVTARRPSARRLAPPRTPATLIMEGGLRPFLPIRRVSFGAFADLALTYLPSIPMFVRAELLPAGVRVGSGSDMGALGGLLSVGYDQRYIAIGLGAGVVYHRDFVDGGSSGDSTSLGAARPRFQFAQLMRAGARDGLHLSVKTAFALASERWRLASVTVAGQVPVATRVALAPRITVAPNVGVFLAEVGVRLLVRGHGGHNSLFLRPVAGVSGTFDADNNSWEPYQSKITGATDQMLFGPMLGIDIEYRM